METLSRPTRNILVEVDIQNDFVTGSLAVKEGAEVVAPLNALAGRVRETGGLVVQTRDHHPESTPHFETWPVHCVAGTEGAAFYPALQIDSGDIVLSKGMGQTDGYSGVEGVGPRGETLERLIQPRDNSDRVRVLIGGLATDYCVRATALDLAKTFGREKNVRLYLIKDAVRAVNLQPRDGADALEAMRQAGIEALSSDEMLRTFFSTEV